MTQKKPVAHILHKRHTIQSKPRQYFEDIKHLVIALRIARLDLIIQPVHRPPLWRWHFNEIKWRRSKNATQSDRQRWWSQINRVWSIFGFYASKRLSLFVNWSGRCSAERAKTDTQLIMTFPYFCHLTLAYRNSAYRLEKVCDVNICGSFYHHHLLTFLWLTEMCACVFIFWKTAFFLFHLTMIISCF